MEIIRFIYIDTNKEALSEALKQFIGKPLAKNSMQQIQKIILDHARVKILKEPSIKKDIESPKKGQEEKPLEENKKGD